MKILFVVHDFLPRHRAGTEIATAALAQALSSRDEVRVVTTESRSGAQPGRSRHLEIAGLNVCEIESEHRLEDLAATYRDEAVLAAFEREVVAFQPDIVHFQHFLFFGLEALGIARAHGARTVMTLHDYWTVCVRSGRMRQADGTLCQRSSEKDCLGCLHEYSRRETTLRPQSAFGRLERRLFRRGPKAEPKDQDRHHDPRPQVWRDRRQLVDEVFSSVDSVVSPSAFLRERILESTSLDPSRIQVIANGQPSRGLRPSRGRPSDLLRVGFMGTVAEHKGAHVFVAAAGLARREHSVWSLHGSLEVAPDYGRGLARAAADASVSLGGGFEPEDLATVLAQLDVLVVPSLWWENAPMTIQEAFMAGVVPVVSGIGGMSEAVTEGVNGAHFPPGDAQALAGIIDDWALHRSTWSRLRSQAPQIVSADDQAKRIRTHYEELLQSAPRTLTKEDPPRVSVVIPTWNAGEDLPRLIDRIFAQRYSEGIEVICLDSESTDGTRGRILRRPRVVHVAIEKRDFDHGLTRMKGVEVARGELILFLSQDALPLGEDFVAQLASHFEDAQVAGVTAAQVPRPECNPFQRLRLADSGEHKASEVRELSDNWSDLSPEERHLLCRHDHVAAMARRCDLEAHPLRSGQFGEDLAWAKDVLLAGRRLVFDPSARVVHSHERSMASEARRVALDHAVLNELFERRAIPNLPYALLASVKATGRYLVAAWRDGPRARGRWRWLWRAPIFAFSQNLAQWWGGRRRPKS